jgi:tetratricopeptide (TPR) repeat protein
MRRFFQTSLLLFALLVPVAAWAQAEPAPSAAFADWLFAQGEYARAAGEYYRYLFAAPEKEKAAVLSRIGSSSVKARDFRGALLAYEKLIASYPDSPLLAEAQYEAAYCSFKLEEYDAAAAQIDRLAAGGPLPPPFVLLAAAGRLEAGDYPAGKALLDQYLAVPGATEQIQARELLALAAEADALPGRDPWAAGLLSFVLPGAGKVYAGRWEDGLVSFALCAFLGGMAAYAFWSEGSASFKAWVYTGLGALFYVADIWGSAVAARQFNDGQRAAWRLKVKASIDAIFP